MDPLLLSLLSAAGGALLVGLLYHTRLALARERERAALEETRRASEARATAETELRRISELNTKLLAEHSALQASAEARLSELRSAHERLRGEFSELSAAALRSNREDFLRLAQENFARLAEHGSGELKARETAIAALVQPIRESLAQVDAKVAELEKSRATAYGQLGQQLESLHNAQLRLQTETGRLASVLSTTRTAGTWGEVQLRRVVELAGMTEHCDFEVQLTPASGERDRADLVVHLPGERHIVVDAKAPTEAYREAAVESDPVKRATKLAEHAAKVRGHCDDLSARDYWAKFQPSPEFVVLFLPGDQFLSAALEADPALMDRAIAKKVLLATPATLIALLKAADYGWRQEAISRNAEEISQLGRQLHDRIATFSDHLDKVGKGLESATKAYNAAVGSLESSLLPGARKFAELGAKGAKDLKSPVSPETTPRPLQVPGCT